MPMLISLCRTTLVPSSEAFTVGIRAQAFDRGAHEKRHVGELGLVALLEFVA